MAAPIQLTPRVELGAPVALFDSHIVATGRGPYDIAPDGQHFVIQQTRDQPLGEIAIVVNWPALLKY